MSHLQESKITKYKYIILGGGPAGLACAHYAHQRNEQFLIIEKQAVLGGNALTFKKGPYLYDSGAHRWHNVYPEITQDIQKIIPQSLKKINVPSSIFYKYQNILFPLAPWDLITKLTWKEIFSMAQSFLSKKNHSHPIDSFAARIQRKYGKDISEAFLWHYTEKLWGESPEKLSTEISGKRLEGLGLKTFFKKNDEHLDGTFYYPDFGIGTIFENIKLSLPESSTKCNSNIQKVHLSGNKITSITLDNETIDTSKSVIINTLSPSTFSGLLSIPPHADSQKLKFRNLVLIFLEIDRDKISPYATIYYPQKNTPVTRIVEPKNRSLHMAPTGKTSLAIEWPCSSSDTIWSDSSANIFRDIQDWVFKYHQIKPEEILGHEIQKIPMAYPLLTLDSLISRDKYLEQMQKIENLEIVGRNAQFSYLHLHDVFHKAKKLILRG